MFYCLKCKQKKNLAITFWCERYDNKKNKIINVVWMCPDCLMLAKKGLVEFNGQSIEAGYKHTLLGMIKGGRWKSIRKPRYHIAFRKESGDFSGIPYKLISDKVPSIVILRNIPNGFSNFSCSCCKQSLQDTEYVPFGKVNTDMFGNEGVKVYSEINICRKCIEYTFEQNKHIVVAAIV